MSTGRFFSKGAVRKCSSIWWKPSSMARKLSGPTATMVDSPMAESMEYRPPTQSQNPNMFAVSMPNSDTLAALVETATKCLAMALSAPPRPLRHHCRALPALVMVSSVVKVLEDTMKSVSAGSRSRTASAKSVPSTFETKRKVMDRSL